MNNEIQAYENVLMAVQKEESLIDSFLGMKDKLYIFAPEEIQVWQDEKKEQFIRKTMITIAHDENLTKCFESNEGKLSLVDAVQKSCSTGLEIGGKHAYLIPQGRKLSNNQWVTEARFSIKASGYFALLCGGDRPIFKDLRWALIYEKDDCKPNTGTGEIHHIPFIGEDAGKIVGCWVQITKKTGQKELKYFTLKKIKQWQACSKSGTGEKSPWVKWFDEMAEQACIRHACEKYEQARDLLTASWYSEDPGAEEDNKDETTTSIIDNALKSHEEEKEVDNKDNWD